MTLKIDKKNKIKRYLPNFNYIRDLFEQENYIKKDKDQYESDKFGKRYVSFKIYNWKIFGGSTPTVPNSEGDRRSPDELVVRGLHVPCAPLPNSSDGKQSPSELVVGSATEGVTLTTPKAVLMSLIGTEAPCKTHPVAKLPSEFVVLGDQRTLCEGLRPSDQKKEIEDIFSRQRISNNLIHEQRSRSVSSFGQTHPVASKSHSIDDKNINLYTKLFSSSNNGKVVSAPNLSRCKAFGTQLLRRPSKVSIKQPCTAVGSAKHLVPASRVPSCFADPEELDESMFSIYDPTSEFNSQKIKCKNIDIRLAGEVGITNYNTMDEIGEPEKWVPPEKHGLDNSKRIIPAYYIPSNMNKNNVLRVDYHYMILDDIRNLRSLNEHQLNYINNSLSESEKYKIIEEFNNVIKYYGEILLNGT